MKTTATVIAIAGLLLATVSPVHAQGTEWEALTKETLELYRAGKYESAVVVAKQALAVAERNGGPDHPAVAQSLNNLARCTPPKASMPRPSPSISEPWRS
jgi:hypothetical protein